MSTSSTTGIGPQDHHLIGLAASLPGKATGQYLSVAPIEVPSPGRAVTLQVRVTAPVHGTSLPLILLSHGLGPSNNLSSLNGYLPMSQYYAAHGFVVVQPTHLGSRSLGLPDDAPGAPGFTRSRVNDMTAVLDNLDLIEAAVPTLQGRIDRDRVAVWGHSMGSHTASALLGMRWTDEEGKEGDVFEPRIKVGVLVGAIGSGEGASEWGKEKYSFLRDPRFETMRTQTLVVNGDADESKRLSSVGYKWHADPYYLSAGPKDLVTMFGGNHSFGGVSGWDSTDCKLFEEESPEMAAAVQRVTLAYLKSKLYDGDKSWEEACKILVEAKLGTHESK